MSINSRAKGQRAEREFIKIIQPLVDKVYAGHELPPPRLERNLMQASNGGYDIVGLHWLALEIKHQETLAVDKWWSQTLHQAGLTKVPILAYRKNQMAWRIRMFGVLNIGAFGSGGTLRRPVDISLPHFLEYFEKRLEHEVTLSRLDRTADEITAKVYGMRKK